jgi:hypothetical protein
MRIFIALCLIIVSLPVGAASSVKNCKALAKPGRDMAIHLRADLEGMQTSDMDQAAAKFGEPIRQALIELDLARKAAIAPYRDYVAKAQTVSDLLAQCASGQ